MTRNGRVPVAAAARMCRVDGAPASHCGRFAGRPGGFGVAIGPKTARGAQERQLVTLVLPDQPTWLGRPRHEDGLGDADQGDPRGDHDVHLAEAKGGYADQLGAVREAGIEGIGCRHLNMVRAGR